MVLVFRVELSPRVHASKVTLEENLEECEDRDSLALPLSETFFRAPGIDAENIGFDRVL